MAILNWMEGHEIKPNAILCLLLDLGKSVYMQISSQTESNVKLQTDLLNVHSKCENMDETIWQQVIKELLHRQWFKNGSGKNHGGFFETRNDLSRFNFCTPKAVLLMNTKILSFYQKYIK
jgi:hypothetical protein